MELFLQLLASRGAALEESRSAAERWAEATRALGPIEVNLLARAWNLARALNEDHPSLHHLGEHAVRHRRALDGPHASMALGRAELVLESLERLDDGAVADRIAHDTTALGAVLETFRDEPRTPLTQRLHRAFPEIRALATPVASHYAAEHEPAPESVRSLPLLDHLADRCLGRKLAALELDRLDRFQRDASLSAASFAVTRAALVRVRDAELLPTVRIAMLFLDFAKGGTEAQREEWRRQGADLSIHNLAARHLVAASGGLSRFPLIARAPRLEALALALIETHGLAGQAVRGETPLALFAPFVAYLRGQDPSARELAVDCMHLIDVCDTAAVREGLLTDALHAELCAVQAEVRAAAADAAPLEPVDALAAREEQRWRAKPIRARIADRLVRLRDGDEARVDEEMRALSDDTAHRFAALLAACQLWYAGAASRSLSCHAQVILLALGVKAAEDSAAIDTRAPFHLSLQPLLGRLELAYRRRLLETALAPLTVEAVLDGSSISGAGGERPVMTVATEIGRAAAIAIDSRESEESRALLTLLPIYEKKSSAAFHSTLKTLCDLYGLRKDDFDRVANEAMYLETMNSARSDKSRMLDFARPGTLVEIGPGGGVVLDLLEQRFATSEIVGVDASRMVVEALSARREKERHRWRIVEADAYRLGELFPAESLDTVVLCSLLHEIYSYVEHDGRRFRLESVRDLLQVAFAALVPGGRILIRDGVMPPPEERILRFVAPDARSFFDLFVAQFEGRTIAFTPLEDGRVRLSSADAMEFLYTYTWGPESFPYEVREQYGVLPYDEYVANIAAWLGPKARLVPLPHALKSYLQAGYRDGLAGKIELFDGRGAPVELPDSNCLIAIEKVGSNRS